MIFVPSSFIRLSEPISRGTVTGQRTSTTRLRVSCPTSRTSEHSSAGARGCDVRMFTTGLAAPRRRSACRTADVRCCETMIFVPLSFIRLSEPISRGTVTGQRTSRTLLRASCPTSRTSETLKSGRERMLMFGCSDVRMFTTGWAAPRRRSACRTADVLALKSHNLDATIFWFRAPNFGDAAQRHRQFCASHRRSPECRQ